MLPFLFLLIALVDGTSWRNKEKQRLFQVNQVIYGGPAKLGFVTESCIDEFSACKKMNDLCHIKVVKRNCRETCWTCRAPAPPLDCSRTKFGCCWDNTTISKGILQEGCPICQDKYSECSMLKKFCPTRNDIRKICPVSCAVNCDSTCHDDQHQTAICPMYKRYGFCKTDPKLMSRVCKKSCGLC